MTINVQWAIDELDKFIELTTLIEELDEEERYAVRTNASFEDVSSQFLVVERILNLSMPDWRTHEVEYYRTQWDRPRIASIHARSLLCRQEEIRDNLGDELPRLSAADLHPWIWDGASSLWQSQHFGEAVEGAIRKLNAETQNKVGRRDVSETVLFQQSFSPNPAQAGKPRLHRIPREDSDTYRSLQRGAMAFAEGIFAGIRNPLAHEADHDLTEQQALEYLAALSVLARWVDEATVEHAEGTP